ncbi:PREDICTED: gibberellin-regulated protein 14-like [Lupinus angustifolius]|uniref:gibberellin-regulated protein 14-like n=1 Tax=Lupinus angustifolius TaxID=3871 RepID=UPI00092EB525|nr:PREDICTED: gibberellin-regulated protein 14-like [Lupinus angustifolius]
MASKSFLLLLLIFLMLVATKVSSYDEDLKIEVNYAKPLVAVPPVKSPPPPPVVRVVSPPPVKAPPTNPSPPPPPVKAQPPVTPAPPPATPTVKSNKDCIPLCGYRCKLHSRKQVCLRACVTCCERCKCVPPGTYGNRDKCGKCYTDMLTHGNRPKCP